MDSRVPATTFPLLELPGELRDQIYEHVLFASAWTGDVSQRQKDLDNGITIHTNILLTSRQVFEEARNSIIRAQLVQVRTFGAKPTGLRSAAVLQDGVPMFQARYKRFCILRHDIIELGSPFMVPGTPHDYSNSILRKGDLSRFCGEIPGLDPDCYVPLILGPRISHSLGLVNPEARLPTAPAGVSIRAPTHYPLLREYQRLLSGCKDIWIYEHWSMEMGEEHDLTNFMVEMVDKIMSSNTSRICSRNGRMKRGGLDDSIQQAAPVWI